MITASQRSERNQMKTKKQFVYPGLAMLLAMAFSCEEYDSDVDTNWDDEESTPLITDGQRDSGHPTVGILNNSCTATLVGKRAVLTAAHCVRNGGSATFRVGKKTYRSSKVVAHNSGDIAFVALQSDVSDITPSPLNTTQPKVGQRITLVGYGSTSENGGGFGTKRKGTNVISRVTSTMFFFAGSGNGRSSNCYGDSGGPAFISNGGKEVVAGVTSGGEKPCGTYAYDTRVDAYVNWLRETARKSGVSIVVSGGDNDGAGSDNGGDSGGSCEGQCSPSCRCGWTEVGCKTDNDCQPGLYCKIRPQLGNRCLKKQ